MSLPSEDTVVKDVVVYAPDDGSFAAACGEICSGAGYMIACHLQLTVGCRDVHQLESEDEINEVVDVAVFYGLEEEAARTLMDEHRTCKRIFKPSRLDRTYDTADLTARAAQIRSHHPLFSSEECVVFLSLECDNAEDEVRSAFGQDGATATPGRRLLCNG